MRQANSSPVQPSRIRKISNLRVAMALHIHKGEGTDVPNTGHIHGEVMKKVNNLQSTRSEPEEQKQRGKVGGQELLQKGDLRKQK
jgi:hypothetical protein